MKNQSTDKYTHYVKEANSTVTVKQNYFLKVCKIHTVLGNKILE